MIDPTGGFHALEIALTGGLSQLIVFPADWPRFLLNFSRNGQYPPFLNNFARRDRRSSRRQTIGRTAAAASEIPSWVQRGSSDQQIAVS